VNIPPQTFYKIMNLDTGEFASRGSTPTWSKTGKVWRTLAHLRAHLSRVRHSRYGFGDHIYASGRAVIVEFEAKATNTTPVLDELEAIHKRREDEKRRREEARQREKEQREKAELARLLQKHGRP
jgi:hypothetical protein